MRPMSQNDPTRTAAGPADAQAAAPLVPDDAAGPAPNGDSPAKSDAPYLLTLVAVAAAEAATREFGTSVSASRISASVPVISMSRCVTSPA